MASRYCKCGSHIGKDYQFPEGTLCQTCRAVKAKDAELTSLKAENEALKEALEQVLFQVEDDDTTVMRLRHIKRIVQLALSPKCAQCDGTGSVTESWGIVPDIESSVACPKCNGTGEALSQSKTEVGG